MIFRHYLYFICDRLYIRVFFVTSCTLFNLFFLLFFQFVSSLQSMAFLAVLSPLEQTKVSNNNLDLPLPQKMKDELGELLSLKRSINLNNNFWEILLHTIYTYFFNLAICRLKYETEYKTINTYIHITWSIQWKFVAKKNT